MTHHVANRQHRNQRERRARKQLSQVFASRVAVDREAEWEELIARDWNSGADDDTLRA